MLDQRIKWVKLLERKAEPLIVYPVAVGRRWYPETLGVGFRPQNIKYEGGWYYLDVEEMQQEIGTYRELYKKGPEFLDQMADRICQAGQDLIAIAKECSQDLKQKTNKELGESFSKYNNVLEKFVPAVWSIVGVEKFLTANLREQLKKCFPKAEEATLNKYFSILTTLSKKSSAIQEYENLLATAIEYKKTILTPDVEKRIKDIYNKFYYLGAVRVGWTYLAEVYDIKHYETAVRDLAKGNPEEELMELQRKQKESQRSYKDLINRKELTKEIVRDAGILQKYIFLRTTRGESVVQAMLYAKKLLQEIASRLRLTLEEIACFIPEEVAESIKTGSVPDINFNLRKEGFILEVSENSATVSVRKATKGEWTERAITEFRGDIAQPGKVKGEIRIVSSSADAARFKKGQILVSSMTRPDMIMAIRKAGAIVTDEGGVTCHASIASREFKIPCIIGTKIATKVLKDGDLVEVDAKKGIVKILEKTK